MKLRFIIMYLRWRNDRWQANEADWSIDNYV